MKKEIYEGLNQYLADVGVLFIKFHNLHWNVVGDQFKNVHEYLETIYDNFAVVMDEVAENLKMNGQTPVSSMAGMLAITSVKELSDEEKSIADTLELAKADIAALKASAESLRKAVGDEDHYDAVAMLEGHLTNYNKTLWFLEAMTK